MYYYSMYLIHCNIVCYSCCQRYANMGRLGFPSHQFIRPLICLFCVLTLKLALSPSLTIFAFELNLLSSVGLSSAHCINLQLLINTIKI